MITQRKDNKRKKVYIKKDFQFKFILKFCLILLMGVILSTSILLFLSQETLTSSFENSRLVIENTNMAILPAVIVTNLITLGIICIAAIFVTLYISHRIAGPMFRFEKDLEEIKKGNLKVAVNLRKKDQFPEIAESLNLMTQSFHGKLTRIKIGVDDIFPLPAEVQACKKCEKKWQVLRNLMKKEFSL